MGTFTVHDEDGKITQSNTIYDHEGYDKTLLKHGVTNFVFTPENRPLHHEDFHVSGGAAVRRPDQAVTVSKTRIKAGGSDSSVISGFEKGSVVTVTTSGMQIFKDMLPATEIEIAIPVPCIYVVEIDKWPYKTFRCQIEAAP